MLRVAVVVLMALCLVSARVPYGAVDPLENLYLQRLYQMSNLQNDPYLPLLPIDDIDGRSDEGMDEARAFWGEDDNDEEDVSDSMYSPLFTGAQARDEEHLEHSALQGLHQVSGGTLEGQPPQKQIKTDKPLPAYCNPPNPCPLGKTAADNCVENFENSMENNKRLLEAQDCPCDTEHMFSCPAGQQTVTSKGSGGQAALNKVMSELAQLHTAQDLSLSEEKAVLNPFFKDKILHTAAKKSPVYN
ncbi:neuroendocrine protein 7B2-like isoform X2 [Babylonia areolata]|uniref:neuroendocrine protein 7B2-like isoform X2 n=1 Tax=Babylonia areolata TaxID=304850 RepID=UPI003FD1E55F